MGEHEVALPLGDTTYDGERPVLSAMSGHQLREVPEYAGDEANRLPEEQTLRGTYDRQPMTTDASPRGPATDDKC